MAGFVVFLLELSSVGEFLDFVSNAQRALLEELQRNHTVAMPLREGIRNHAVAHPATLGTQGLHAPSEYANPFSRTAAMSTTGFSNQMVKGTLGVNNTHSGWVEMDGSVGLRDCHFRWEVELNVIVGARRGRNLARLPIPNTPWIHSPSASPSLSMKTSPTKDADTLRLTRCDDHVTDERWDEPFVLDSEIVSPTNNHPRVGSGLSKGRVLRPRRQQCEGRRM